MKIEKLVLGQERTNCYVISHNNTAIVIDPACNGEIIEALINKNNCQFDNKEDSNKKKFVQDSKEVVWLDLFGIKLYFDDVLILSLLFFLYKEEVKDEGLFLALVMLLIS